jgi:3-phosphoshikimate 1-carboxyvinyltransferase
MGGDVTVLNRSDDGEPAGDLLVRHTGLHAVSLSSQDIPGAIDELPLIALLATQAEGITVIHGAEELRVKETDRITVVTEELRKLGASVTELPDGMTIQGPTPLSPRETHVVDTHGDHRIGMMLGVAALLSRHELRLRGEDAVAVSYPEFFSDLDQLLSAGRPVRP